MEYTINDIEKIVDFKTWSVKQKVDELLRLDCKQYTNLGIDSTKTERDDVKKTSRKIYRLIKKVDKGLGDKLLHFMD
ncbi:MAG: hypothetical protein GY920_05950 [Aliivibrio sp.]|jgi:hypothetical protein|nr:hypothetical protein [Aliivibrio sp.]